jgi:hypothetical protein
MVDLPTSSMSFVNAIGQLLRSKFTLCPHQPSGGRTTQYKMPLLAPTCLGAQT